MQDWWRGQERQCVLQTKMRVLAVLANRGTKTSVGRFLVLMNLRFIQWREMRKSLGPAS